MSVKVNPFHIEAVATYGAVVRTCSNLEYMRLAGDQLNQYLISYTDTDKRYGAAIGLVGGHGSGKTHLLMWLSQSAESLTQIRPVILYAKADRSSIFDLYMQMFSALPRESLVRILDEALRGIARVDVQKAKITESISARIEDSESLRILQQEENIDVEALQLELERVLEDPNTLIPQQIPRAITKLSDPVYGEKVYQWLSGKSVAGLEDLKLDQPLLQLDSVAKDSSGPDVTGVNVLETIGAALRLAGRPLIILIDQLEVLLRAEPSRQQIMFSVLKKLIEQLNRQKAITFIAGNDESWSALPPDVLPRLRIREPLRVGNLSIAETRSLLEAYIGNGNGFSQEAAQSIHSLSGGNPREIIRIAYYAFETTAGEIADAPEDVFVQSANKSGSVAERARRALEIANEVLKKSGSVAKNLAVPGGSIIDQILKVDNQPRLALVAVKATDQLSEITSARRVHDASKYIMDTWQGIPLIVVTVGYSSTAIRDLLQPAAILITFHEVSFASELQTKITEVLAQQPSPRTNPSTADTAVVEVLETIAARLDKFEAQRTQEVSDVAERFATKTEALHAPAEKERESQTRWDLLNELDEIQGALDMNDVVREQRLMKSLLVANEVNLKRRQLDYLGGIYLDVLSAENNWLSSKSEYDLRDHSDFARYRFHILRELRRLLRNPRLVDRWLEKPFLTSTIAATALIGFEFLLIYFYARVFYAPRFGVYRYAEAAANREYLQELTWRFWWVLSIPAALLTIMIIGATAIIVTWYRRRRWERLTKRLSGKL